LAVLSISANVSRNDIIKALRGKEKILPTQAAESFDKINEALAQSTSIDEITKVQLDYINDKGAIQNVAKEYYIQEIIPRYINSVNGIQVEVTLKIYSMDKRLTLDKYCRAYTGRKLFTQLINKSDLDDIVSKSGVEVCDANINDKADDQQTKTTGQYEFTFLKYKTQADTATEKSPNYELIQPYMVQYNESFYDLITRIANRCGEFLYFEDGKLCMGLKESGAIPIYNRYKSITYKDNCYGVTPINQYSQVNFKGCGSITDVVNKVYDLGDSLETYITKYTKDEFTTYKEEYLRIWTRNLLKVISGVLLGGNGIVVAILTTVITEALDLYEIYSNVSEFNEGRNEAYIDKATSDQRSSDKKNASLYSSYSEESFIGRNLTHLFYTTIHELEQFITNNTVEVDLGENFDGEYKLGKTVIINNESYVVIGITGMDYMDSQSVCNYHLTLAPTIPLKNEYLKCPPLLSENSIRTSSPQLAVIADNLDPERLGRVRVRFVWQTEDDDMSPFIQVKTPFATKNGGMYFRPQEGDRVLLDFANGNIEHPYVAGSLHTKKRPVTAEDEEQVISSVNGHSIKFSDPSDPSEFIGNLWGSWNLLTMVNPSLGKKVDFAKDVAGGIEITDRYGFYSIQLSSTDRSVNIQSTFGDVNINAFTGINISSPNGDVRIEGKNVEIVANNNLTITSGDNIIDENPQMNMYNDGKNEAFKNKYQNDEDTKKLTESLTTKPISTTGLAAKNFFTKDISSVLGSLAAEKIFSMYLIDFRLLRAIIESVVRPQAGTMKIKSWRFMVLEAGRGHAEIPSNAYTSSGLEFATSNDYGALVDFNNIIANVINAVDLWTVSTLTIYNETVSKREGVKNLISEILGNNLIFQPSGDKNAKLNSEMKSIDKDVNNNITGTYLKDLLDATNEKDENIKKLKKDLDDKLKKSTKEYKESAQTYFKKADNPKEFFEKYFKLRDLVDIAWLIKALAFDNSFKYSLKDEIESNKELLFINSKEMKDVGKTTGIKFKRRLIHRYVTKEMENWEFPVFSTEPLNDFSNDEEWTRWVEELHEREDDERVLNSKGKVAGSLGSHFQNAVKSAVSTIHHDVFGLTDWSKTKKMWGPLKEGEIVFSDKDNHTISFDNGHLKHVKNNQTDRYLEVAKKRMKGIITTSI
jgi:hypothetical protein